MTETLARGVLQMSLTDVAALARVQRPVVSVWRSRSSASDAPFPQPVATVRGEDRFDVEEVIDWLEMTGRGNNNDVRGDAAAFSLPKGMSAGGDEQVFRGLTALLCLRGVTGEPLAGHTADALLELGDDADPDDELLARELEALGDRLPALARFADQATDAAYSVEAAFEKLMAQRFRLSIRGHAAVHLTGPAHDLVVAVAVALTREVGMDPGVYVDPTPGSSDLLVSLIGTGDESANATILTTDDDAPASRLARRRLRVHGVHRAPLAIDDSGAFEVTGAAVHLAAFPSPAHPALDPSAVLTAVDNIQLQMTDDQRAVVLAPASVLTDRLADRRVEELRDQLLRLGRVRAIVRLPQGLVTARPRQALALWVLGPDHAHVRPEDRWTAVADLSDIPLSTATIDDLVSDIVAAMGDRGSVHGHAFRFARIAPTVRLLAGRRALIPGRATTPRPDRTTPAALALRIDELRAELAGAPADEPLAGTAVRIAGDPGVPDRMPLGEAVARGLIRVLPGNRLDPADVAAGAVTVLGVEELAAGGPVDRRGIDRLDLAERYDAARLTEPGDVVFATSPRPAARVDHDGGSVVTYPARVLRITTAASGLLPALVAADINAQPATSRAWRNWSLQRVPAEQEASLADALDELDRQQTEATARVQRLLELRRLLVQGVAGRTLTLQPNPTLQPDLTTRTSPMEGS